MLVGNPPDALELPTSLAHHRLRFAQGPALLTADRAFFTLNNDQLARDLHIRSIALPRPGPLTADQLQAFRVGRCAWGVQFHPEARREQVMTWWSDGRELPRPLPALSDELDAKLPAWHELGRKVCLAFLAAASD